MDRRAVTELDIVDGPTRSTPHRDPLHLLGGADLAIHKVYDGGWFVGRPTLEELRHDLRAMMQVYHPD
jgi:hypothetical protein